MATKDITDTQVIIAYKESKRAGIREEGKWPYDFLVKATGQPEKVCYRAMERAYRRGLVDCGTTLISGWVTEKAEALLSLSLRVRNHEKE